MKHLLTLVMLVCMVVVGQPSLTAQRTTSGTRFVLPIPPAWAGRGPDSAEGGVSITLVAADTGQARVTVPFLGIDTTVRLRTDRPVALRVPASLPPSISGMITNRAISVTASVPVSVVGQASSGTAGVLHAPVTMWGTEYRTVHGDADHGRAGRTYFVLVAGFHDTHVSMTPPVDYHGGPHVAPIPAGETGTVTMHEGQVLVIEHAWAAGSARSLAGTLLRSDKPITVLAGYGPSNDASPETGTWRGGCQVLIPHQDASMDVVLPAWTDGGTQQSPVLQTTVVQLVATDGGTVVTAEDLSTGAIPIDTLAAGERTTYTVAGMGRIRTSKPVHVTQNVPVGTGEAAVAPTTVLAHDRWGNYGVVVPVPDMRNMVSVVLRTADTSLFRINGLPLRLWLARTGSVGGVERAALGDWTCFMITTPDTGALTLTMDGETTMMAWHRAAGSTTGSVRPAGYADLRTRPWDSIVVASAGGPDQEGRTSAVAHTVDALGRSGRTDVRTILASNMTVVASADGDATRIATSVDLGRYDGLAVARLRSGAGRFSHLVSLWRGRTVDADSSVWRLGIADIDDTVCADLVITNTSSETIAINDIAVEGRPSVRLTTEPLPLVLPPGASTVMQGCVYSDSLAADADSVRASVILSSSSLRLASFTISASFRQGVIFCPSLTFDQVDPTGAAMTRTARIENAGDVPVTVRGLHLRDTAGALTVVAGDGPWPIVIPAGGGHGVEIRLQPVGIVAAYDAEIVVVSTAGRGDSTIDIAIRPGATSIVDPAQPIAELLTPNPVDRTGRVVLPCRRGAMYRIVANDGRTLASGVAVVDRPSIPVAGLGLGVVTVVVDDAGRSASHRLVIR